ncbi:hypothetical protein [Nonomuraea sp. NPDC005650]|uniref:hypothetical protein n=1 Tax=Nonomuraea sp. NPDC005650 TaxID=3157045 RepID=UPI0033AF00B3
MTGPHGHVTPRPDDKKARCGGPRLCRKCADELAAVEAAAPEQIARAFHETYERLAPSHGYQTRPESSVPWEAVPEANRTLMVAVATELLAAGVIRPGNPTETGPTTERVSVRSLDSRSI